MPRSIDVLGASFRPRNPIAMAVAVSLAACGGASAPARDPSSPPHASADRSALPPATADSCADAQSCRSVGFDLLKRRDEGHAKVALEKACALHDVDACAALATLEHSPASASHAAAIAHNGCIVEGATDDTRAARGAACRAWGEALDRSGSQGAQLGSALVAFEDGCKLGDAPSCATARHLHDERAFDAAAKEHVGQPNFHEQRTKGGVSIRVACHADTTEANGPADSSREPTSLADNESAIAACAARGEPEVRFVWSADASRKVTMVRVLSADEAVGACITQALMGAPARRVETCMAHLAR